MGQADVEARVEDVCRASFAESSRARLSAKMTSGCARSTELIGASPCVGTCGGHPVTVPVR